MRKQTGFSLLEVLLATTVITIGIAAMMSVMQASWTKNTFTEEQNLAIASLSTHVERLKAMDLTALETEFGGPGLTNISHFYAFGLLAHDSCDQNPPPPPYPPVNGDWYNIKEFQGLTVPFEPGREPAQGSITAFIPNPPGNPNELVEITIRLPYVSRYNEDPVLEEVTIWVSPLY